MSQYPNRFGPNPQYSMAYEAGESGSAAITSFFNAVYAWMSAGLALTAVVAWWVSTQPELMARVIHGPLFFICIIAELALVFTVAAAVQRISAGVATALFMLYAALNGLTLSIIFVAYTQAVLSGAFIITAGMFAAMSIYGHVTKRDLTAFGSLLFMGLIGIVLASVVSLFWANSMLTTIINYVGVFVFIGLTAYDTQRLRQLAVATQGNAAVAARLSVNGALMLYLDFINLFLFLVRILSDRRQ
jgi:FtsH-binding integral membrane protein